MDYILYHKKTPVIELAFDNDFFITGIGKTYNPAHLPPASWQQMQSTTAFYPKVTIANLRKWWQNRSIPVRRDNLDNFIEYTDLKNPQTLAAKGFGLSLSDHYWINPVDNLRCWENINFFENPFSLDVGLALFDKFNSHCNIDFLSPDNTLEGVLDKRWIIEKKTKKRILIKGGTKPFQQEPYNEVIASVIFKSLGISCVPYTLQTFDTNTYSLCYDFVSPNTEFISAANIITLFPRNKNESKYNHFLNTCERLGIGTIRDKLDQMLLVDYILANKDRHFNNFGFLRNPDTLQWIGFAPVFDSGTSLFYNELHTNFYAESQKATAKPFAPTQQEQIKLIGRCTAVPFNNLDGLSTTFLEIMAHNPYSPQERNEELCKILTTRINEAKKICK